MDADDRPTPAGAASAKRKLAAILHADVVGYSRLMGEDEVGTHARLMAYRQVIDDVIARHDGRVVSTAGDAVLTDFPSVIEALSAAVDIQHALAEQNEDLPPEQTLEFRIGINLGDVIVDGDDIFGDGVNLAARLQEQAPADGILISSSLYDQVVGKVERAPLIAIDLKSEGGLVGHGYIFTYTPHALAPTGAVMTEVCKRRETRP